MHKIAFGNQTKLNQHKVETLGSCFGGPPGPADGGGVDKILPGKKVGKGLREAGILRPRQFRFPARWRGRAQQLLDFE